MHQQQQQVLGRRPAAWHSSTAAMWTLMVLL
jgi:hypothetical protein